MGRLLSIVAGSIILALSATSQASTYLHDDGTAEFSTVGGSHQVLAVGFQVLPGSETITNMGFYHFWFVADGHPMNFHLWTDPNNDGDILDATLQRTVVGVVDAPAQTGGSWQTVEFNPIQLSVGDWFYVGISFDDDMFSYFLGGNDTSGLYEGRSWTLHWANQTNPGQLNTGTIGSNQENLLIRANVAPVPEPATILALSLGAAAVLRKRRRK